MDVPGLTEAQAQQLVEWVETQEVGQFGKGTALDPRAWLTLHLDRHSAQMIYDALMGNPATATPEHGLAEVIGEWLSPSSETR